MTPSWTCWCLAAMGPTDSGKRRVCTENRAKKEPNRRTFKFAEKRKVPGPAHTVIEPLPERRVSRGNVPQPS